MTPVSNKLAPDETVIHEFIADGIRADIHLAAIEPDGPIKGRYFGDNVEAALRWAVASNRAGRNIYWTANRCQAGVTNKPSKPDIHAARFSHVDIDPPKDGSPFDKGAVLHILRQSDVSPSVIVDSGNGLQALWRLEEHADDLGRVESINKGIALQFGGDSGHNIDRLLRVPGTINYPTAAKRKRGCVPIMARLLSHELDRAYSLGELEAEFPPAAAPAARSPSVYVEAPQDLRLLSIGDLTRSNAKQLAMMIDQPEKHFRNKDRSAWVYGIACQMCDEGYQDNEILGVLLNTANLGCAHIGDQTDPVRAAVRALTRARSRYVLPPGASVFGNSVSWNRNRPTIKITPGELAETVDLAEQALLAADLGYFQSGGRIVRVGVIPASTLNGSAGRNRIMEVGQAEIAEALTTAAVWLRSGPKQDTKVDCPSVIAETYLARVGKWKLPPLAGVVDIPTLRPDGSLLTVAGYDSATGLLLVPRMPELLRVPISPMKTDALDALTLLLKPLVDFPFVTEADRSVALSALLTSVCMPALGNAPLHGFSAHTAGSGKSTLVDLASILRSGRAAAPISQGKTEEELEKRLGSLLLEGEGVVAIDNCERPLGGEFLCQLMTQPSLKVRPLGKSVMIEVPTTAMVTATGNNLTLVGDMGRRALLCQLDPGVERPELREFDFDPMQVMIEQRNEFVAAALTILRAYHIAGRPFQVSALGSFANWSNLVRSALIWLGCTDPCETMDKVRKADPIVAAMKPVMVQWSKVIGAKPVTTGDLNSLAEQVLDSGTAKTDKQYKHPDFRDALLAIAGEGQRINGKKLGNWLAKHEGRIIDKCRFNSPSFRGGQKLWVLEKVALSPSAGHATGG